MSYGEWLRNKEIHGKAGLSADLAALGGLGVPHPNSMFMLPLNQSGNNTVLPRDYSSHAVVCEFGASVGLAEPWANAGYLTTADNAGQGVNKSTRIPVAASSWDLNTDSIALILSVKKAAPASDAIFCGNCDTTAGSGNYGILLRAKTTGKLEIRINADTYVTGVASTSATVFDAADHQVMFCLDAATKTVKIYVDGALDVTSAANAWAAATNHAIVNKFYLGSTIVGDTVACQFKGVQLLKWANAGLPININDLAKMAYAKPRTGISATDPVFT